MKAGLQSNNGSIKWEVGKWKKEDKIDICHSGFHASVNPIHAMGYVNCEILAKVEVRGKSIIQDDKQCWSEMKIVKVYDWKKEDSVALAIYAAELVIDLFEKEHPNDKRPRKAIEAARKWLKEPSEANMNAASAASASAHAAAATSAAAYTSASAAAYASAYASASDANAADKIRNKCAKFVLKRIKA